MKNNLNKLYTELFNSNTFEYKDDNTICVKNRYSEEIKMYKSLDGNLFKSVNNEFSICFGPDNKKTYQIKSDKNVDLLSSVKEYYMDWIKSSFPDEEEE